MAIHESKQSWDKFKNEILMPKLSKGITGGFTTPPQEQVFEIVHSQTQKSTQSSQRSDLPESRL